MKLHLGVAIRLGIGLVEEVGWWTGEGDTGLRVGNESRPDCGGHDLQS
jgi:hypothetical protein